MGLKEYITKKQLEKSAPKYNIHSIYYAFTNDGQFFTPFVFNSTKTKIKDIENERVICLKDGEYTYANMRQALSELFSVDANNVHYDTLIDLVNNHTYGLRLPGKIFKKVRAEICDDFHNRETIINYGSINYLTPNVYDLKPLTKQLSENFSKQYNSKLHRESILSSVEENCNF